MGTPSGTEAKPPEAEKRFPWSLEDVLKGKEIWLCASCFTCVDRCPRDVGFTEISIALRNLAARQGIMPDVYRTQASTILQTGYVYKIPASRIKMRAKYGLPDLPEGNVEQVRKLMEAVGLPDLIKKKEG